MKDGLLEELYRKYEDGYYGLDCMWEGLTEENFILAGNELLERVACCVSSDSPVIAEKVRLLKSKR